MFFIFFEETALEMLTLAIRSNDFVYMYDFHPFWIKKKHMIQRLELAVLKFKQIQDKIVNRSIKNETAENQIFFYAFWCCYVNKNTHQIFFVLDRMTFILKTAQRTPLLN